MLLDLEKLFRIFPASGCVIHLGAHKAEERDTYIQIGLEPRVWVEAQRELADELQSQFSEPEDVVIHGAVWHKAGLTLKLNQATDSQSSSLLDFDSHSRVYPETKFFGTEECKTITLASLLNQQESVGLVSIDLQGVELNALLGAGAQIREVPLIYTEVNFRSLYKGGALVGDIDSHLRQFGFTRAVTARQGDDGWGDALYVRNTELTLLRKVRLFPTRLSLLFWASLGRAHRTAVGWRSSFGDSRGMSKLSN